MDSIYIEERQIIARYVRGTLSGDEVTAFELYMLDHPETADEVEYEKGLQGGLLRAEGTLFGDVTLSARQGTRFWLGPRYAAAATVLLSVSVVGAAYLFQRNVRLASEIDSLKAPSALSAEVWLERMRGASSVIIEKRADEGLLLHVVVETPGAYEVRIRSVDNGVDWSQSHVSSNNEKALLITAKDLPFGRYELTATSDSGGQAPSTYSFDLAAPK